MFSGFNLQEQQLTSSKDPPDNAVVFRAFELFFLRLHGKPSVELGASLGGLARPRGHVRAGASAWEALRWSGGLDDQVGTNHSRAALAILLGLR